MEKIEELRKRKELNINAYIVEPGAVILFVTELNEFNLALEGTVIDGRRVMIRRMLAWVR